MVFKKGNTIGKQFSSDNQPTAEARNKAQETRKEKAEKRKELKEQLEIYLDMVDKKEDVSNQELACIALVEEAKKGNTKAFETIRDTIGQKPTEKQELIGSNIEININRKAMEEN